MSDPSTNVPAQTDAPVFAAQSPRPGGLRRGISREEFAKEVLGIGVATLDRLESAGKIGPVPARLGGRRIYILAEVDEWLASKSQTGELPDRRAWEAIRAAADKK